MYFQTTGLGTERHRLALVPDVDDWLGAKSKVKCSLAVLSAGNARGPLSWAGRTEAGASNIVSPNEPHSWPGLTFATTVTCDQGRSSAGLVTGFSCHDSAWPLVWSARVCKYRCVVTSNKVVLESKLYLTAIMWVYHQDGFGQSFW